MSTAITEECAGCAKVILFVSEEERQLAYLKGGTSEAFCAECRAKGYDAEGDVSDG